MCSVGAVRYIQNKRNVICQKHDDMKCVVSEPDGISSSQKAIPPKSANIDMIKYFTFQYHIVFIDLDTNVMDGGSYRWS